MRDKEVRVLVAKSSEWFETEDTKHCRTSSLLCCQLLDNWNAELCVSLGPIAVSRCHGSWSSIEIFVIDARS